MSTTAAANSGFQLGAGDITIPLPSDKSLLYIITAIFFVLALNVLRPDGSKLPHFNPRKPFEFTDFRRIKEFMEHGIEMTKEAKLKYGDNPYRMFTAEGDVVVLPSRYTNEIAAAANTQVDSSERGQDDTHNYIPGYEPFDFPTQEIVAVINRHLTKVLGKLTPALSFEAQEAIRDAFTENREWHEINPSELVLPMVSRVSSRIFMGEQMCRNKDWVAESSKYAALSFGVGHILRGLPRFTRPIVHWFMPGAWAVRRQLNVCRKMLAPVVADRKAQIAQAVADGREPPAFDDAMSWFEGIFPEGYDPAVSQITLSVLAIHTTSDLLLHTMVTMAQHPEIFEPMREEVRQVLGGETCIKKTALYEMKLMDSVFKECQRVKPILLWPIRRQAKQHIKLSDGFVIRKGEKINLDITGIWDPEVFENANEFDPYRYVRWRETPGLERRAQLVMTSPEMPLFGHGPHACPGRFFAANEVKIMMTYLLLHYEWKLAPGCTGNPLFVGSTPVPDPTTRLLIRKLDN